MSIAMHPFNKILNIKKKLFIYKLYNMLLLIWYQNDVCPVDSSIHVPPHNCRSRLNKNLIKNVLMLFDIYKIPHKSFQRLESYKL